MSDVKIVPVSADEDLFAENPELHSIWSPEKSALAAQYAREDAHLLEVFKIVVEGKTVGTTGWFTDHPEDASHVCRLRWTGVIESYRRRGITTQALMQLIPVIKSCSGGRYTILIESIPVNEKYDSLFRFFSSLGFVLDSIPYSQSWTSHDWQDMALII